MAPRATIDLVTDPTKFKAGCAEAIAVMDKTKKKMAEVSAQALTVLDTGRKTGAAGQPFAGIKAMLGEESGLGMGVKMLAGAGAIAAVGKISNMMGEMADRTKEWVRASRAGEATWKDIYLQVSQSVPIASDFLKVMEAVGSVLDDLPPNLQKQHQAQQMLLKDLNERYRIATAEEGLDKIRAQAQAEYKRTETEIVRLQREATTKGGYGAGEAQATADASLRKAAAIRDRAIADAESAKQKGVQQTIDALKSELQVMREGEAASKAAALAKEGATQAQIKEATALQNAIDLERQYDAAQKQATSDEQRRADGVQSMIRSMKDQTAQLLLTKEAYLDYTLVRDGATAAERRAAAQAARLVDEATRVQESQNDIKAMVESVTTPWERYEQTIGRLNDLMRSGLPAETYSRAIAAATESLQGQMGAMNRASAFEGFGGAYERIRTSAAGMRSPQQQAEDVRDGQRQAAEHAKALRTAMGDVKGAIATMDTNVVGAIKGTPASFSK